MSKGIMIVGYGTRKGNLESILEVQRKRLLCRGWKNVEIAYFRVSKPTIQESLDKMVKDDVDDIVVLPYYIAEGTLTKELIPDKLGIGYLDEADLEIDGKTVTIHIAPAFGNSFILTDIICDRIAGADGDLDSGILILGHGTRHRSQYNMHVIKLNAERLRNKGYKHVTYAFNEFCKPTIKDALDELERSGVKKIVAIPLFIAMGLHLGDEIPEQMGIPSYSTGGDVVINGRTINIAYTRPMEDDSRLTDYLDQTAREYL